MLGILLNSLISARKVTDDLSTVYNIKQNIFGQGNGGDYTVSANCNIEQVYNTSGGFLEFHDFTVNQGVTLKPNHYTRGRGGCAGTFSPLILKCSGTLTVNGAIASGGTGGMTERYDGSATFNDNQRTTGIALDGEQGPGYSCSTNNFFKLATYGANGSFFDFKTGLYGAGGGGGHNYKRGRGHHRHKCVINNYGFSCGGRAEAGWNHCLGCGGGFVALYFRHLYYVNENCEYGVHQGFPVDKISANGVYEGGLLEAGYWGGGGSIIIAADTIILGPDGTINSNALRFTGGGSTRYSIMNNPPQLCSSQYGYIMDQNGNFNWGSGQDTYYYTTGFMRSDNKPEVISVSGSASSYSGGAGVALGFKIGDLGND